jgi:hypothetical protein
MGVSRENYEVFRWTVVNSGGLMSLGKLGLCFWLSDQTALIKIYKTFLKFPKHLLPKMLFLCYP